MSPRITEAIQRLVEAQVGYALTVARLNQSEVPYEIHPTTHAIEVAKRDLDNALADHNIPEYPTWLDISAKIDPL